MTKWKKNNYKFWHSPLALIVFFCVLAFFGYKIIDLLQTNSETNEKKEQILNQIDALQKKEKMISSDLAKLETEEGKEEVIRDKYQVAKEGEKMVTIVEDTSVNSQDEEKIKHGFWNWLKKVFSK